MARFPMVVASNNQGKLVEIQRALLEFEVLSPAVLSQSLSSPVPDPNEDGTTYLANARIKATAFSNWSGSLAIADDSGLEIDALDRRPGLHSARYAGPQCSPQDNIEKVLAELSGLSGKARRARFVCCLALCRGDQLLVAVEGQCWGEIVSSPTGSSGFGYDPIFRPDGDPRTFAEMSQEEKDGLSHRGDALDKLRCQLREMTVDDR